MKTIDDILNNYNEYEVALDDRFGIRLCSFLTEEQANKIGYGLSNKEDSWCSILEWTEKNVKKQLKEDVLFAMEKMSNRRGISSGLMHETVKSWLKVLEDDDLVELLNKDYIDYGKSHMREVAKKYNIDIKDVDY